MQKQNMTDRELILNLGGPVKVCELLGYDKYHNGYQRVYNWMIRPSGIPAQVKLDHPEIFLKGKK